jgi:PAN domain
MHELHQARLYNPCNGFNLPIRSAIAMMKISRATLVSVVVAACSLLGCYGTDSQIGSTPCPTGCALLPNTDTTGVVFERVRASSPELCQLACQKDLHCAMFSYTSFDNFCYLKAASGLCFPKDKRTSGTLKGDICFGKCDQFSD